MKKLISILLSLILTLGAMTMIGCAKEFTVTFNANGGSLADGKLVQVVKKAEDIEAPTFTKIGYDFDGFDTDLSSIKEDATVKALWKAKSIKITYDLNDSTEKPAVMEGEKVRDYKYDSTITLPIPTRAGYVFSGWKKDNQEFSSGQVLKEVADFTLVASWVEESSQIYTISYFLDGGSWKSGDVIVTTFTKNDDDILLKKPIKEGYDFIGWKEVGVDAPAKLDMVIASGTTSNKSFEAVWEKALVQYTIKFESFCTTKDVVTGKEITINVTITKPTEVLIPINSSLGDNLPTEKEIIIEDKYKNDYIFYSWYIVETKPIRKDTVFTQEEYGNENREIVIKLKLGGVYSNPH